ncbi:MAG TPA: hypothetical protein VKR06_38240 [Ktedonosporobacter sp.]|nr:hypothetical protein [Ktedonosporobacter sp.]
MEKGVRDLPIIRDYMREEREQGLEEGREKGREEGLEQGREEGREEERKKALKKELRSLRNVLVGVVEVRMPELRDLARQQAALIEKPQILHALTLNLAKAQTLEEAQRYLLNWQKSTRKKKV